MGCKGQRDGTGTETGIVAQEYDGGDFGHYHRYDEHTTGFFLEFTAHLFNGK